MKIVVLNNLYPPYNRGGAEKIAKQEIELLKKQGHQVFVITTKSKKQELPEKQIDKVYYINSLYNQLDKINIFFKLFWHLNQFFYPLKSSQITKILKKEKPDLAITHNLLGLGWRLPLILKKLNIKHHHYLHDIQLLHPSGLMLFSKEKIINNPLAISYQTLTKYYFKNCHLIVSPSSWLINLHLKKGFFKKANTKIKTINKHDYKKIVWPKKINKLLFVGQLEKHKGIIFLLNWYRENKNNDLSLTIIGDGNLKKYVEKESVNNPNISYLGKLEKKEILNKMKEHDCLIVPSLCYENSPTVIFEANQCSLPVIASKIGGIIELENIFNLKLFTPNDFKSLNKHIYPKLCNLL